MRVHGAARPRYHPVLLLLIVFAIVNVCALVLRREPVEHDHFRALLLVAGVALWSVTALTRRGER